MKLNYKKTLKLVTLLLASVIIATVSAQTYKYMYIDGSVVITSSKMVWYNGGAEGASVTIDGGTATVDLTVEQNKHTTYDNVTYLKNENATGSFSLLITVTTAVAGADFTTCNMHIYQNSTGTWVLVDTIDLINSADSYTGTLSAGNYFSMMFEVETTAAASGTKPFDVQVRYN